MQQVSGCHRLNRMRNKYINKIICGDCLEIIKGWPDNCVDLIIMDPPYSIGKAKWDIWNPIILDECKRVLKENRAIFCWFSQYKIGEIQREINKRFNFKNIIAEVKTNMVVTTWDKDKLQIQWEPIIFAINGEKAEIQTNARKFEVGIHGDVWRAIVPQSNFKGEKKKLHPCQKDITICERAILLQSNLHDIVLDPFCGSGTTCLAAKRLGRRYVGIDISKEYCGIARMRLKKMDIGIPVELQKQGFKGLLG